MPSEIDKDKLKAEFGIHVRQLRLSKEYSLRKVQSQCSIDNSKLSKIESGKFDIQLSTIYDLARGLGVHPTELLTFKFDY